ncbi:hypothetical protein M432DRAFT_608887 [Thermoascus aurantiacus ATCC 26904]
MLSTVTMTPFPMEDQMVSLSMKSQEDLRIKHLQELGESMGYDDRFQGVLSELVSMSSLSMSLSVLTATRKDATLISSKLNPWQFQPRYENSNQFVSIRVGQPGMAQSGNTSFHMVYIHCHKRSGSVTLVNASSQLYPRYLAGCDGEGLKVAVLVMCHSH